MSNRPETIAYLLEQIARAGVVSARPMFGEAALYCDGKVVALVCEDQLFVKPTPAGRNHGPDAPLTPPYPGAKGWLLIDGEHWDDAEYMSDLIRLTAAALPAPKPKAGVKRHKHI